VFTFLIEFLVKESFYHFISKKTLPVEVVPVISV
jgi:hypothetical protein